MIFVGGGLYLADAGRLPAGFNAQPTTGVTPLLATANLGQQGLDAVLRPPTPVQQGRWQAIVIHHSGSAYGRSASIGVSSQLKCVSPSVMLPMRARCVPSTSTFTVPSGSLSICRMLDTHTIS